MQTTNEELIKKTEESPWAETKARASNFGAPVLFQDNPMHTQEIDKPDTKREQDATHATTLPNTSNIENEPLETQKAVESILNKRQIESADKSSYSIPGRRKKRDIEYVKRRQKRSMNQDSNQSSQPITLSASKTVLPAPAQKTLPTLAQLTQGFLYQPKDKGTHTVHMLGNKNSLPTDQQLKCERYIEKLSWCIQNIFNIHNNHIATSHRAKNKARILLTLNQDGSVRKLALVESSESKILDQFFMFVFKEASSSFPPVPHYLPHDPFSIVYTMMK